MSSDETTSRSTFNTRGVPNVLGISDTIDTADAVDTFDPIAYLNEPRWRSSRLGLERIESLMAALGNPQDKLTVVHVAGTNGKGSTCAMVASVLQHAGYRTGLFTSPYIIEFTDRIRIDGQNVSLAALCAATQTVRRVAEQMDDHPTEFELMTAVAFVCFVAAGCTMAVVEVGLGGRLDSTNVIAAPAVCALAPISFDHTDILGSTLAQIAHEKAGIIKPGAAVVSALQRPEAMRVIENAALQVGSPVTVVDEQRLSGTPAHFSYRSYTDLSIPLKGSYQTHNAALAIEVIDALIQKGITITEQDLREGLAQVSWPGRFQVVSHSPEFIVDGGHNPQGAQALVDSLEANYPARRTVLLIGVLADKDVTSMLRRVLPSGCGVVCITPPNPRALGAQELASQVVSLAKQLQNESIAIDERLLNPVCAPSIGQGVTCAQQMAGAEGLVCAFGSLYSIADIMAALDKHSAD